MKKYDDAEYCFLNFETDLENEAGGTHIGMYLAWAAHRKLLGELHYEPDNAEPLNQLLTRQITGCTYFFLGAF